MVRLVAQTDVPELNINSKDINMLMRKQFLIIAVMALLFTGCEPLEVPEKDIATYEADGIRFSLFLTQKGTSEKDRTVEFESGDAVIVNSRIENLTGDTLFFAPYFSNVSANAHFAAVYDSKGELVGRPFFYVPDTVRCDTLYPGGSLREHVNYPLSDIRFGIGLDSPVKYLKRGRYYTKVSPRFGYFLVDSCKCIDDGSASGDSLMVEVKSPELRLDFVVQ